MESKTTAFRTRARRGSPLRAGIVFSCVLTAIFTSSARGGLLSVQMEMDKPSYLLFESMPVRVTVRNMTGETILVGLGPGATYPLDFMITDMHGLAIERLASAQPPPPTAIDHGEEKTIGVDLVRYYRIRYPTVLRIIAMVSSRDSKIRASSQGLRIEVVKGRSLWRQEAGIPGTGRGEGAPERRTYEILVNRVGPYDELFLRIQDPKKGLVYCVHSLGRYVPLRKPDIQLDARGWIHILRQMAPRTFGYSVFDAEGKRRHRSFYSDITSPPELYRDEQGDVTVLGGEPFEPARSRVGPSTILPTAEPPPDRRPAPGEGVADEIPRVEGSAVPVLPEGESPISR